MLRITHWRYLLQNIHLRIVPGSSPRPSRRKPRTQNQHAHDNRSNIPSKQTGMDSQIERNVQDQDHNLGKEVCQWRPQRKAGQNTCAPPGIVLYRYPTQSITNTLSCCRVGHLVN